MLREIRSSKPLEGNIINYQKQVCAIRMQYLQPIIKFRCDDEADYLSIIKVF
jgi:hypothetical protein